MRKSVILLPLIVLSFFCVFFFSSQLKAQFIGAVDPNDLLKEPPLTQADIDFTIKYYQLVKLENVDQEEDAIDKIMDFLDNSGFTLERRRYAVNKIGVIMDVLSGEMKEDEIKESYFKSNDKEKELVKKNLPALTKALNEAYPK
jgi:hypothetical protein